jgi:hypothetical protein
VVFRPEMSIDEKTEENLLIFMGTERGIYVFN